MKLPEYVKVVMTSRPETEASFSAWSPTWIQPEDRQNMEDMQILLRTRLEQRQFVAIGDLQAATEMVLRKSQVIFVVSIDT